MIDVQLRIFYELETHQLLSERFELRGGVIEITSTSSSELAANKLVVYDLKGILR